MTRGPSTRREAARIRGLCESVIELLATRGMKLRFPRGAMLFGEGDPVCGVYLILQGRVRTTIAAPQGKTVTLALAGRGDSAGMMSAIRGGQYETRAEVVEPAQVAFIPRGVLLTHLEAGDREAARLLGYMAELCHNLLERLRVSGFATSAEERLTGLFLGTMNGCATVRQ